MLHSHNLKEAVLPLAAMEIQDLGKLRILTDDDIDALVNTHGCPVEAGKLLKSRLAQLVAEIQQVYETCFIENRTAMALG